MRGCGRRQPEEFCTVIRYWGCALATWLRPLVGVMNGRRGREQRRRQRVNQRTTVQVIHGGYSSNNGSFSFRGVRLCSQEEVL
jgi:hypothetical protein